MTETGTVNKKAKKSPKFSVDFKPRLFSTLKNYNKQLFAKDAMAGVRYAESVIDSKWEAAN